MTVLQLKHMQLYSRNFIEMHFGKEKLFYYCLSLMVCCNFVINIIFIGLE